jgi:hypothetical protein
MRFYFVLSLVFLLTLACFIGNVVLSSIPEPSDLAADSAAQLLELAETGMAAVLGLVGGKVLS